MHVCICDTLVLVSLNTQDKGILGDKQKNKSCLGQKTGQRCERPNMMVSYLTKLEIVIPFRKQ